MLWRSSPLIYKADLREMMLSRFNFDDYALGMGDLEPAGSSPEGVLHANIKNMWNKAIPHLIMAASDEEFEQVYRTSSSRWTAPARSRWSARWTAVI